MKTSNLFTFFLLALAIGMLSGCGDNGPSITDCSSNSFEQQDFYVNLSETQQLEAQNYPSNSCYDFANSYSSGGSFTLGCGGAEREHFFVKNSTQIQNDGKGRIQLEISQAVWIDEIDLTDPNFMRNAYFKGATEFYHTNGTNDDEYMETLLSEGMPTLFNIIYRTNDNLAYYADRVIQPESSSITIDSYELVDFIEETNSSTSIYQYSGIITGTFTATLAPYNSIANGTENIVLEDIAFRMPIHINQYTTLPVWCD